MAGQHAIELFKKDLLDRLDETFERASAGYKLKVQLPLFPLVAHERPHTLTDTYAPSQTAEAMALFRALETLHPAHQRLFADPLAKLFLRPAGQMLLIASRVPLVRRIVEAKLDRQWPGARTSAIARTRMIDDAVVAAIRHGAKQVAILGAGFDTRAHRLRDLRGARVFELDRPATQQRKIDCITRQLGSPATPVTYVPADFLTSTVNAMLRAAGFNSSTRSLVIWEGVTNYLSDAAVGPTLRGICTSVGPGSEMVFTYVHRGLLDRSVEFVGGAQILDHVSAVGEPWTWGLNPAETAGYLAGRGWTLVEDLSADEYRERYFGPAAGSMSGYSFYRTVRAIKQ